MQHSHEFCIATMAYSNVTHASRRRHHRAV